jgi:plasmid stabilization system protein ParE
LKVRFHPAAVDEFEEAALYYASQKPGLDLRFIEGVQAAIRAASEAPTRWRVFERGARPTTKTETPAYEESQD